MHLSCIYIHSIIIFLYHFILHTIYTIYTLKHASTSTYTIDPFIITISHNLSYIHTCIHITCFIIIQVIVLHIIPYILHSSILMHITHFHIPTHNSLSIHNHACMLTKSLSMVFKKSLNLENILILFKHQINTFHVKIHSHQNVENHMENPWENI